jgi:hypothetical protein
VNEQVLARKALRIPDATVVVATDAFEHVSGPVSGVSPKDRRLPSATHTYRSLAEAIVHRDPDRFRPGKSNVDWRSQVACGGPTWSTSAWSQ